jgi:hypothetical protein
MLCDFLAMQVVCTARVAVPKLLHDTHVHSADDFDAQLEPGRRLAVSKEVFTGELIRESERVIRESCDATSHMLWFWWLLAEAKDMIVMVSERSFCAMQHCLQVLQCQVTC